MIRVIGSLLITSQGTQRGVLEVFQPRALRVHCHFTLAHLIIDNRDTVEGSPSITTSLSEQSQILPTEHDEGLNYLEKLQRDWIRAQRPEDPRLICCDYDSAERAERLGLPGKKENGGAHLCLRCLGVEYQDALP